MHFLSKALSRHTRRLLRLWGSWSLARGGARSAYDRSRGEFWKASGGQSCLDGRPKGGGVRSPGTERGPQSGPTAPCTIPGDGPALRGRALPSVTTAPGARTGSGSGQRLATRGLGGRRDCRGTWAVLCGQCPLGAPTPSCPVGCWYLALRRRRCSERLHFSRPLPCSAAPGPLRASSSPWASPPFQALLVGDHVCLHTPGRASDGQPFCPVPSVLYSFFF